MNNQLEGKPALTIRSRVNNAWLRLQREWRIASLNRQVREHAQSANPAARVVFFNASTRLSGFSQNAAFSLLTSWGVQIAGGQVSHFACHAGMSRCVLGTNPDDFSQLPPCQACIALTKRLLKAAPVHWFEGGGDAGLEAALQDLPVEALARVTWLLPGIPADQAALPLGELVLPSLRWALRRHDLVDDQGTRALLRQYLLSAFRVAQAFNDFIVQAQPHVVVVFNGTMFPEAAARWVAQQHGIRVVTHEVGFQPFSAFFTEGQATAYPMQIPDRFELSPRQDRRLSDYLSQRFQGEFTMAGIRFWPQMDGLGDDFLRLAAHFRQIVPVFTNVVNDTSQVHACTVFSNMYDWLDHLVPVFRENPETLFVIRAHPDEKRRGTRKHSRQPVSDWVVKTSVVHFPNVIFVDSNEPLSSYELIRKSKFVIVYNSSIGLEASLLGIPVLCGGKARYTQIPTVFFPQTPQAYIQMAEKFLKTDRIEIPSEFKTNARRILYWQLYRTAIPFDRYLEAHPTPGYVQMKPFSWRDLTAEESHSMQVLVKGILAGGNFLMTGEESQP